MKVSEKIKQIIRSAEEKFGTSYHLNDCVSVEIYFNGDDWQVSLLRPTERQMANGEVDEDKLHTVRQYEHKVGFVCAAPTLVQALNCLEDEVLYAEEWS